MSRIKKLLIATRNKGKARELKQLLETEAIEVVTLEEVADDDFEVEETGASVAENAVLKARGYGERFGLATVADDTGLMVHALGGKPGVKSKRFGATDAARVEKLLQLMEGAVDRAAYFLTVVAFYAPEREEVKTFEGKAWGEIGLEPKGERGFGYDPIFVSDQLGKTFAEAELEEKNQVSHRAQALKQLVAYLLDE